MRDFIKITIMTLIGLAVAIVVYPFLHESGHTLTTILLGGTIREFTMFPLPSVLSDISQMPNTGLVIVGLSGVLFPLIISVAIHPKQFYFWYSAFVLKGIVLLSLVISGVIVVMNVFGITDANDDMIKVLNYWQNGTTFLLPLLFLFGSLTVALMIKDHPIRRILKEFV